MIGQFLTPQFRRFLLAGGVAACVNVGTRMLFDTRLPYTASIVLAFFCGLTTGYLLSRRFVFTDSQLRHRESTLRFALVNAAGLLQTWLVSLALGDHLLPALGIVSHAHDLAHIAGVATPVFSSFLAHRHWTFG